MLRGHHDRLHASHAHAEEASGFEHNRIEDIAQSRKGKLVHPIISCEKVQHQGQPKIGHCEKG